MYPWRQYDRLPYRNIDGIRQEICNDEHIDIIAGQGPAQHRFTYLVFIRKSAYFVDETDLIRVSEWVAVGEEDRIIVMFESYFERESVEDGTIAGCSSCWLIRYTRCWCCRGVWAKCAWILLIDLFLFSCSLVIGNIKAISIPTNSSIFSFLNRVYQRLHPLIVGWFRFHEVDNIESVDLVFSCVLCPEEVPLCISARAIVVFQEKVIFKVWYLYNFP